MDTLIILLVALVLVAIFIVPYYLKQRNLEKKALAAEERAHKYGLWEPASLHPIVDANQCIGTGNCVAVCPEKDVLGLISGQAHPVSPARCIGHGLCERSCPVEAIQLVFGTEKRGVDIPRIQENFETNVPGIYIVGELGGMGLIRNSFIQGRQCLDGIMKEKRTTINDALDVLIVGCGPAGLSATICAKHHSLRFVTIEKENIGGTVSTYPRKKVVMTQPLMVPGYGKLNFREIQKESLIELWDDIITKTGIEIQTKETVDTVTPTNDGCFLVTTNKGSYKTMRVVLAIGRRGVPRKLNVPGEEDPKVAYALREPEEYQNNQIVVVGGGDSAIEAALALSDQPGNEVCISYRKDAFSRIKPGNLSRIEEAVEKGAVKVLWSTNLTEILPNAVIYSDRDGETHSLSNDYVFIFAGGILPTGFLHSCGIRIDKKFGDPARKRK